jgi:hypothetical protein
MLFLPFQNAASMHQTAPNRMQILKKIFRVQPRKPSGWGLRLQSPGKGKGREWKDGRERRGKDLRGEKGEGGIWEGHRGRLQEGHRGTGIALPETPSLKNRAPPLSASWLRALLNHTFTPFLSLRTDAYKNKLRLMWPGHLITSYYIFLLMLQDE